MSKTITVTIPVYNMSKYLDRCIQSVLAQTYKDFVLLIVDDGSTDDSGKICDEYAKVDSRVMVIHTKNQGVGMAHNVALDNVKTDYIMMLDSDDCINKYCLEILMSKMQENDADMVYSNIKCYRNDQEIVDVINNLPKNYGDEIFTKEQFLKKICSGHLAIHITPHKLYKTSLFEGVRYPNARVNIDEWVIHHIVLNAKKVAYTGSQLYYYRYSAEGMTRKFSVRKISGTKALIDRMDTILNSEYKQLVPSIATNVIYHAIDFNNKCMANNIRWKKEYKGIKKDLKRAYNLGIKSQSQTFSKKDRLKYWLFSRNLFFYKIYNKLAKEN